MEVNIIVFKAYSLIFNALVTVSTQKNTRPLILALHSEHEAKGST